MFGRQLLSFVIAVVGCTLSAMSAAQEPKQMPNVVRQIDHILIASSDAQELFALLSETFQFPIVWPMSSYGTFASGGVAVGNVNLEVLKAAAASGARFRGFAFEPEPLRTSLPVFEARRIRHGKPAPFTSKQADGSVATLWTTVGLPDVSSDTSQIFLCEYEFDVPARRLRFLEQLQSRNGGPLSVHSVREIVYGVADMKRMQEHWQKLLAPVQASSHGVWPVGAGPAIRLIQADKDEIQGLVLSVKSLQQARRFLREQGLLGTDGPTSLTMAGPRIQGLSITLVE
jgi:hypothetical protein